MSDSKIETVDEERLMRLVAKAVRSVLLPMNDALLAVSKEAHGDDLLFVASGAFRDRDDEHVGREFLSALAKQINDGETVMTVDWWHTGFPSRSNPTPTERPILLGGILEAKFENEHLALRPYFPAPIVKEIVRQEDLGLSIWFEGARRNDERVFEGKPGAFASVAVLPKGFESYPYMGIYGGL